MIGTKGSDLGFDSCVDSIFGLILIRVLILISDWNPVLAWVLIPVLFLGLGVDSDLDVVPSIGICQNR